MEAVLMQEEVKMEAPHITMFPGFEQWHVYWHVHKKRGAWPETLGALIEGGFSG